MAFTFTYAHCTNPDDMQELTYNRQDQASQQFQNHKRHMKQTNDKSTPDDGPHLVKIGVTDSDGKQMEDYSHRCNCHGF